MSTVEQLAEEILRLPAQERKKLNLLLYGFTGPEEDDWDRQMKADAEAGKLDKLAAEALEEYNAGKTKPWP